jgi:hypothetical protein
MELWLVRSFGGTYPYAQMCSDEGLGRSFASDLECCNRTFFRTRRDHDRPQKSSYIYDAWLVTVLHFCERFPVLFLAQPGATVFP